MGRLGFAFSSFLIVGVAGAVDFDFGAAKLKSDQLQAQAAQAERVLAGDEQEFQRLNGVHVSELELERRLQTNVDDKDSELRRLSSSITTLDTEIPREDRELRELQRKRPGIQADARRAEENKRKEEIEEKRSEAALKKVEKELKDEQAKTPVDAAKVAQLTAEKNRAQAEHQRNEQQLRRAESEFRQVDQQLRSLNFQITNLDNSLTEKRANLARYQREWTTGQTDLQNLREDLRRKGDDVRAANTQMEDGRRQRDRSKADSERQKLLAAQAYEYYRTVYNNYIAERDRVIAVAKGKGAGDGKSEGSERAPDDGLQAGSTAAASVGLAVGTGEAKTRENRTGYRAARATPALENASYQAGLGQGQAWASKKALAEDFPRGFNDSLSATLASTPSRAETFEMPETDPAAGAEDGGVALQPTVRAIAMLSGPVFPLPVDPAYQVPAAPARSGTAPAPDWRYFNAACAGLALAEFETLCQSNYEASYRSGLNTGYADAFARAYGAEFARLIRPAYDAALKQAFPAEYQAGVAQGATDQGILDGFGTHLPVARQEQYVAGQRAWDAYLAGGHLLRVNPTSTVLNESSGDGLFTPGENASLSFVVDNLGKKPIPAAAVHALVEKNVGFIVSKTDRALPRVEADTRLTIKGAAGGTLLPSQAGAAVSLTARVQEAAAEAGRVEAGATVHFPLELQSITLAKNPKVDEIVDAKLRFKNLLAEKAAAGASRVYVAAGTIDVTPASLLVPELQAGEETELTVKLKPTAWVGKSAEVGFVAETQDRGGISAKISQLFPQGVAVDRSASMILYDAMGKVVTNGTIPVNAGGRAVFQLVFQYERTVRGGGPYQIARGNVSDPGIRNSNNSIVSSDFGFPSPGMRYNPVVFSYDIPASLKGKPAWVSVALKENGKFIQLMQVFLDVR